MYESENTTMMTPEEELVDLLLDFIIVSANLAKSVNHNIKQKQIKEGGISNGKNQRIGNCSHECYIAHRFGGERDGHE